MAASVVAPAVRSEVRRLDPELPVDRVLPLREVVSESVAAPRFRTLLLGVFAVTALLLAAIGVFVIEREFVKASAFAAAGSALTFFGFMHGEQVGFAVTPSVAVAYAIVAAGLLALGSAKPVTAPVKRKSPRGVMLVRLFD